MALVKVGVKRYNKGGAILSVKSQSAMEYLMTYGWAILIIAVVLGALYSLGVFNAVNFMPKVPGGGCHVFRPNGPGTSWNVNLVGSCNNALPQYVARFNGQSSYVGLGNSSSLQVSEITVTAWVYQRGDTSTCQDAISQYEGSSRGWIIRTVDGPGCSGSYNYDSYVNIGGNWKACNNGVIPRNGWVFVGLTYNGSALYGYTNGGQTCRSNATGSLFINGSASIGASYTHGEYFNGSIANVQVYNTSLTANQVKYLYNEGIGGVPISPQYLVGWWPLNGDTTDYSGNNNDGVPTAITFNGTWTNGYNVP